MKCIYCGCEESRVVDSRSTEDGNAIRRRRECEGCGRRFTTYEKIDSVPLMVVKKDRRREPFDSGKLRQGIMKACEKRPVSVADIDKLTRSIEMTALRRRSLSACAIQWSVGRKIRSTLTRSLLPSSS